MGTRLEKTLKERVERVKAQNRTLREKVAELKKEMRSLQQTLKETRKMLSQIPAGVVLIQGEKIIFASDTVSEGLGYAVEEVQGRDFMKFVHPEEVQRIRELHTRRLAGRAAPDCYETCLITRAGKKLFCEVRVKKLIYRGRKAFLLSIIGLNEKKEKESRLVQSSKLEALTRMAKGLNREMERLLIPLNQFLMNAGPEKSDLDGGQVWKEIEAAVERGEVIADQLALLSKVKPSNPEGVVFDLRKVVKEAVMLERPHPTGPSGPRAGTGNVQIKSYLRSISPVRGNPDEIKRVITDLISNAIEALPKGGVVYLSMEEDSGYAHVYIQDNGPGMEDKARERIFDPFFSTKGGSAPGMGLSLARAAVMRHGGEIEVMSQPGGGSTFIVKLPLAAENPSPKKARGTRIKEAKILMLAEEGMVKDLLLQLFVSKGAKVTATSNVREGFKLLKKNRFDLVIADPETPYLELSSVIPRIKEIHKDLPVVLVNAPHRGKRVGADLVIGRPMDMDKTLSLVSDLLPTQ